MCNCWFAGPTVSLKSATGSVLFFFSSIFGQVFTWHVSWQTNKQKKGVLFFHYPKKTRCVWQGNGARVRVRPSSEAFTFFIFKIIIYRLLKWEICLFSAVRLAFFPSPSAVLLVGMRGGAFACPCKPSVKSGLHLYRLPTFTTLA